MHNENGSEHSVSDRLYDVDASDPDSRLIERAHISSEHVQQISSLMMALGKLREAEDALSEASLKYMRLNQTDMRALRFLMVSANEGVLATPGAISSHLKISSASTTKLLDRLENAGHITRSLHPTDRRALAISVSAKTEEAAMATVGKQHAKRFNAASRLTPSEREIVTKFLIDMTREIDVTGVAWAKSAGAQADG